MRVTLKPLGGALGNRQIPITGEKYVIGRAADCDVQIPLVVVSRHHCAIVVEDGVVRVRDLGSKHGTFVNEDRVEDVAELQDGDTLHLAVASFEVRMQPATLRAEDQDGAGNLRRTLRRWIGGVSPMTLW